ncbi:MAG TPA: heavy metal-binding domain-containing protein [Chloroflexota bacterium]|nr:heavy metal-binding domain-containing protein [Chloroflexota bacterium]
MPLFHRESAEERQRREAAELAARQEATLQERSLRQLEAGGLPARAQERIAQIRSGVGGAPYSSDLSVDELLFARQSGYAPLGLVSGSSVYHIGWNSWTMSGELDAQTAAMAGAAYAAIDRMRQEAEGMGALGVAGVHLQVTRPQWGEHLVEVIALGTALKALGDTQATPPFLCGLSGQELWSLLRMGTRPAGLVFGNSTFYIRTDWRDIWRNTSWYNQEMQHYTQGLYQAQRYTFGRMHELAARQQAHGVIGVHIEHSLTPIPQQTQNGDETIEYNDYVVEYLAWGTAVIEAPSHPHLAPVAQVLDLEDAARSLRVTAGMEGAQG